MPADPAPPTHLTVAARLRAAGCVFAEEEAELLVAEARTGPDLEAMVRRRADGLPLEYVLGWAEFRGERIIVEPGVFVPRRRTAFLVQQAIDLAPPRPVAVDLCCGSGAVGRALGAALPGVELHAADIDPVAVRCARRNIEPAGGQVYEGDLYDPLPEHLRTRVDLLMVNAPYVPSDAIELMPPEARLYEPRVALDGGTDGLDIHRRVAGEAVHWLRPGGSLLIETNESQAPAISATFRKNGLRPRVTTSDELSATVVIGTSPAVHSGGQQPIGSSTQAG